MPEPCGLSAAQRQWCRCAPLRKRANGCEERCPPEAATSNGRVKLQGAIDRRQYSAHAALPALGIVCNRRSDANRHPPYGCCRPAWVVVRSCGLVASHSALHRGWSRLVARDLVMKAEVYRDNAGFWMARIEEDASTPENRGIGRVYRRQMLPVAPSASKAEAEAALRRVMSREARCPHGHR